jgi:hypothetical protein
VRAQSSGEATLVETVDEDGYERRAFLEATVAADLIAGTGDVSQSGCSSQWDARLSGTP